jgi:hypothetical protein
LPEHIWTKWTEHIPNGRKIYKMARKCTNARKITKWPDNVPNGQNITNGRKIYQINVKYKRRTSKICSNCRFLYTYLPAIWKQISQTFTCVGVTHSNFSEGYL